MLIGSLISWWYGAGWKLQTAQLLERLTRTTDTFSLSLLLRTFFSPFRQLSVGQVRGPLGVQLHAIFDRLLSRFIGAIIRTFLLIFGSIAIVLLTLIGGVWVVVWPLLPFLPVLGILMDLVVSS